LRNGKPLELGVQLFMRLMIRSVIRVEHRLLKWNPQPVMLTPSCRCRLDYRYLKILRLRATDLIRFERIFTSPGLNGAADFSC
jgi:hypothetical protein